MALVFKLSDLLGPVWFMPNFTTPYLRLIAAVIGNVTSKIEVTVEVKFGKKISL